MIPSKNLKIQKYHWDEVRLALLILASDLSKSNEDVLTHFAEHLEGSIDFLESDYLGNLHQDFRPDDFVIKELKEVKLKIMSLFGPQWSQRLRGSDKEIRELNALAKNLLIEIKMPYQDPHSFIDDNLNVDWE